MLKIKDNRNNREKRFCDLDSGAVFCFCNTFYMKILEIVDANENYFTAVRLVDGGLDCFDDGDELYICCNSELIIND